MGSPTRLWYLKSSGGSSFPRWSADILSQNEKGKATETYWTNKHHRVVTLSHLISNCDILDWILKWPFNAHVAFGASKKSPLAHPGEAT